MGGWECLLYVMVSRSTGPLYRAQQGIRHRVRPLYKRLALCISRTGDE